MYAQERSSTDEEAEEAAVRVKVRAS